MPRDRITLNGKQYKIAYEEGARRWATTARPSQPGDPARPMHAEWRIDGPILNSYEQLGSQSIDADEEGGFLGVDYTDNVDTRWGCAVLGPLINTVTLSTHDGGNSPATANGFELAAGMNATLYGYVIRGTPVAKVKISDMTLVNPGTLINLAEAATSILKTETATGTKEISIGMAATAYRVITAVATDPAADTHSANGSTQIARIIAQGTDRVVALKGQQALGNILTGAVTMNSPSWNEVSVINGESITATGFALDGDFWVVGTNNGPYYLDAGAGEFFALIGEIDTHDENCREMVTHYELGCIIPLADGVRFVRNGNGASWGTELWRRNTSPVQGRPSAHAGTTRWLYQCVYNERTTDTYLIAWHQRETGDPHVHQWSPYTLATFTATQSKFLRAIGTANGVRTNPTLVGGYGTNMFYITLGRTDRHIDDSNYRFAASGTIYMTEMRRHPHLIKDLEAVEFESDNCASGKTLTVGFSIDGAAAQTLTGTLDYGSGSTLNGVVNTDGFQRLLFVDNSNVPLSWATGRRIKPQVAFATDASTTSPKIEGIFRLYYRVRPLMTTYHEFTIILDEDRPDQTVEEQQEQLLTEWGSGPVAMTEDLDNDTYYVRVESVMVREERQRGGGSTTNTGSVRHARIVATVWPTTG